MPNFSLSSKRPTMTVDIDGEAREIPVKPNASELASMAALSKLGEATEAESMKAIAGWFADFARPYLGSVVDECDGADLMALENAWFAEFNSANGTSQEELGE